MDHAVALVQAYLQTNGYFTVAEYPVLARLPGGGVKSATDIDVLALRLGGAGGLRTVGDDTSGEDPFEPDPALAIRKGLTDVLLVEVKEGRAELNPSARDPRILSAVLGRFGLGDDPRRQRALEELGREGDTEWPDGTRVRLVAFGSTLDPSARGFHAISLPHVVRWLRAFVRRHWGTLGHAQIRQPALGFLSLLEQVERETGREEREGDDVPGRG